MRYYLFQALVVDILVETIVEVGTLVVAFVEVSFGLMDSIVVVVVVVAWQPVYVMVFKYMFHLLHNLSCKISCIV